MAYISKPEVKMIREDLKATFGKDYKFSVRGGNTSKLKVTLLKSPLDFSEYYSVHNPDYLDINEYNYRERYADNPDILKFLNDVYSIILNSPTKVTGVEYFDDTDYYTDYFNRSYYYDLNIGDWNKPYVKI